MFDRERWNEILEALTSNMFRTLMTAFGVFWGIFILIIFHRNIVLDIDQ